MQVNKYIPNVNFNAVTHIQMNVEPKNDTQFYVFTTASVCLFIAFVKTTQQYVQDAHAYVHTGMYSVHLHVCIVKPVVTAGWNKGAKTIWRNDSKLYKCM